MVKTITDELSALKLEISQIELPPKTKTKLIKQVDHIIKKTKSTKRKRKPDAPPSQFERLRVVNDSMANFAGWGKGQLVCYIPTNSDAGTVSCVVGNSIEKCTMTTDKSLVTIPVNAIIDFVEYFGTGGFATKDTFSIGLGQLNQELTLPLIEDATSEIANERNGGCKQFLSYRMDERKVLYASNVNVVFNQPVTVGGLMIVIYYHMNPI